MPQKITHGYKELMAKAEAAVESVSAALKFSKRDAVEKLPEKKSK